MIENQNIYDELKELEANNLVEIRKNQRGAISENYFKEMSEIVQLRVSTNDAPTDYFDKLSDEVLEKINGPQKVKKLMPNWAIGLAASLLLALVFLPNLKTNITTTPDALATSDWTTMVTDDELISFVSNLDEDDMEELFELEDTELIYDVMLDDEEDLDDLLNEISSSLDYDWDL